MIDKVEFECPEGLRELYAAHKAVCAKEKAFGKWGRKATFLGSPLVDVFPRYDENDEEVPVFGHFEELPLADYGWLRTEIVDMLLNKSGGDGGDAGADGGAGDGGESGANDNGANNAGAGSGPKEPPKPEPSSVKAYLAHSRFAADEMALSLVVTYRGTTGSTPHAVIVDRRNNAFYVKLGATPEVSRAKVATKDVLLHYWGKQAWVSVLQERYCKIGGEYLNHYFDERNFLQKRASKRRLTSLKNTPTN